MTLAIDIVSWILLGAGALVCVVGGIGLLRLPDFYTRTHAAGITDTLGVALVLSGLAAHEISAIVAGDGDGWVVVKLMLLLVFIYLTSPTASHALAKAAYAGGLRADRVSANGSPGRGAGEERT
jgi:multicomponent Na+:H+ antiporter subunit G